MGLRTLQALDAQWFGRTTSAMVPETRRGIQNYLLNQPFVSLATIIRTVAFALL
jgi:hypothetical protein